jgi:hypothetical protein
MMNKYKELLELDDQAPKAEAFFQGFKNCTRVHFWQYNLCLV